MFCIPVKYLPHQMTVRVLDPNSDYEGEYLKPYTINNVRFEPIEALNENDYKLSDGAKGRVFIDAINSKSEGDLAVPVGAKVDVGDTTGMRVLTCTPYSISNEIHHWEVDVG